VEKRAVIIGAGPAGLTAALELLRRTSVKPALYESDTQVGGISKTIVYRGNRMDIGGHRFFSKSDWVMNWWQQVLPPKKASPSQDGKHDDTEILSEPSHKMEACLLRRPRLSRIYYLRRFFDYPIRMSLATMKNLGMVRLTRIGVSYIWASAFRRKPESSLEDFMINRFGGELYRTFFRDYTQKVWGVPCDQISAEWGGQRIKGLSIISALKHAVKQIGNKIVQTDIQQKEVETSLIEQFLYPNLGPGQMWETAAAQVIQLGGKIETSTRVTKLHRDGNRLTATTVRDSTGEEHNEAADYFISTMPVSELIENMDPPAPPEVQDVARNLPYRDFITIGVLVKRFRPDAQGNARILKDNWIYIQDSNVRLGRLQLFNNWSPSLVADEQTVWLGLEYFCNEGDDLWSMSDEAFSEFAVKELVSIDLINAEDVLDTHVARIQKAYPAYFGSYARFDTVRNWLDGIENLFLVGRNGMHRYNNQDHSMLTAKLAVDAIAAGSHDKSALWAVNLESDYHEENNKQSAEKTTAAA